MKLKVGSRDPKRDLRRAHIVREAAGDAARVDGGCEPAMDPCRKRSRFCRWVRADRPVLDRRAERTPRRASATKRSPAAIGAHKLALANMCPIV